MLAVVSLGASMPFWPFHHTYKVYTVPYSIKVVHTNLTDHLKSWGFNGQHIGFTHFHSFGFPNIRFEKHFVTAKPQTPSDGTKIFEKTLTFGSSVNNKQEEKPTKTKKLSKEEEDDSLYSEENSK